MKKVSSTVLRLQDSATVAIIGGGPAGAFSAIHLLRKARECGRTLRVIIFESRCHPHGKAQDKLAASYVGCPQCAGGISPRLHEALDALGIALPSEIVQARISSITVQGNWKSIYLPVPESRTMSSVFRGTLPFGQHPAADCFDAMLLGCAATAGAEVIGSRVFRAAYDLDGRVELSYQANNMETVLTADFAIFAGGVNDKPDRAGTLPTATGLFQLLQPAYVAPRLRKALIFELEARTAIGMAKEGELHYVESSSGKLRLDMCSMLSKRGYITVSLVGKSVDESGSHQQNLNVIKDFLGLRQIRRALPVQMQPCVRCICNPSLVVGTAQMPFGDRIAAVGDMATSRQYKDGILAAHDMAAGIADTILHRGIDRRSVVAGYGPAVAAIKKDNRYATVIFMLYRWFFANPFLSRIIYQTFASEKKSQTERERKFKNIFWAISSGDQSYEQIAWSMLRPATLWSIFRDGLLVTLRNWLTELAFGISWRGIARFSTAVSKDDLEARRSELLPAHTWSGVDMRLPEFECIYSIRIRAGVETVRSLLAQFGETSRPYLNPRWVRIRRTSGEPLQYGCTIEYSILGGLMSFSIEQQPGQRENLIVYRVRGGFAEGGLFCFEVEPLPAGYSLMTIYLVFDYARGSTPVSRLYWGLFRRLFPEFIHEVLWNNALCELKQVAELRETVAWEVRI
jgi:hypothetical protein